MTTKILEFPDAAVRVESSDGKRTITVEPVHPGLHIPRRQWTTSYPIDLIEEIARIKGPAWLCDEIMRDEEPSYVQRHVKFDILSYVTVDWFRGKRVLDFGSGCGASTVVMARMLPEAEIVGVELLEEFAGVARRRASYYGLATVSFQTSPSALALPPDVGDFDAIVMSAVYEHLLPAERPRLLGLLWERLRPGGILFINQTPHRFWPVETHTTGLPLLNYLPPRAALVAARRLSKRVSPELTWDDLLRKGIRGGTVREIMRYLESQGGRCVMLEPTGPGVRDRIDLWYRVSAGLRMSGLKQVIRAGAKALRAASGQTVVPALSLAIQKR